MTSDRSVVVWLAVGAAVLIAGLDSAGREMDRASADAQDRAYSAEFAQVRRRRGVRCLDNFSQTWVNRGILCLKP